MYRGFYLFLFSFLHSFFFFLYGWASLVLQRLSFLSALFRPSFFRVYVLY